MYYFEKTLRVSIAHRLDLSYSSDHEKTHGHTWIIKVYCKENRLDMNDMLFESISIKDTILNKIDNKHLNKVFIFNPTLENVAKWIVTNISGCYKCEIWENETKITYED